jgi:hypothetical protein
LVEAVGLVLEQVAAAAAVALDFDTAEESGALEVLRSESFAAAGVGHFRMVIVAPQSLLAAAASVAVGSPSAGSAVGIL